MAACSCSLYVIGMYDVSAGLTFGSLEIFPARVGPAVSCCYCVVLDAEFVVAGSRVLSLTNTTTDSATNITTPPTMAVANSDIFVVAFSTEVVAFASINKTSMELKYLSSKTF